MIKYNNSSFVTKFSQSARVCANRDLSLAAFGDSAPDVKIGVICWALFTLRRTTSPVQYRRMIGAMVFISWT